jgi:hypothetical protein
MFQYADKCQRENFNNSPKEAWITYSKICLGFQSQLKKENAKQFQSKSGSIGHHKHQQCLYCLKPTGCK